MEKAKRKAREFQLRRTEILEQSVKIFAAKGFYNTTVAEIADASGFAVGTLYQFFAGKEQLYTELLSEKTAAMYAEVRESVTQQDDVVRKIEVLIAAQFEFVQNNAEFCSIFVRGDHLSLSEGSRELRKRMMENYAAHVSFIEAVMEEGICAGVLKPMDPRMMAVALTGIINSCATKWLTLWEEFSLKEQVPLVVDIFLEGVKRHEA